MPRITAKVEGRGNGIKTVLTNIIEVAASLNREAPEITKFFGCELGSQTTYAMELMDSDLHRERFMVKDLFGYVALDELCDYSNSWTFPAWLMYHSHEFESLYQNLDLQS